MLSSTLGDGRGARNSTDSYVPGISVFGTLFEVVKFAKFGSPRESLVV